MNHKKQVTVAGFIIGILCIGIGVCIMVLTRYGVIHYHDPQIQSFVKYVQSYKNDINLVWTIGFILTGILTVTLIVAMIRVFCCRCCRNSEILRSDGYQPINQEIADDNIIAESDV